MRKHILLKLIVWCDNLVNLNKMLMTGGAESDATSLALMPTRATTTAIPNRDTTWTKLFVGGLPYHTTDKSLRDHFSVFGDIEEAVVITDRQTNKSRGYGFVIMGDRASTERACKDPNPIIDGRKANVNLAILGAKARINTAPGFPYTAAAATSLRAGYSIIPNQFGVTSPYIFGSPYLSAAATVPSANTAANAASGLVSLQASQLSHAAAIAAASNHFYEYHNALVAAAAGPYAGQYPAGFEAYPYSGTVPGNCFTTATEQGNTAAAGYITPYTYATLPHTGASSSTGAFATLSPYPQANNLSNQDARLQ